LREGRLEYGGLLTRQWVRTENKHGDN
jgi:hypothetical protein